MAVFDVEMTQRCISERKCREVNPLMPSSQTGQLSINFALVALDAWYSFWLKKHQHKVWWVPPVWDPSCMRWGSPLVLSISELVAKGRYAGL